MKDCAHLSPCDTSSLVNTVHADFSHTTIKRLCLGKFQYYVDLTAHYSDIQHTLAKLKFILCIHTLIGTNLQSIFTHSDATLYFTPPPPKKNTS